MTDDRFWIGLLVATALALVLWGAFALVWVMA